MTNTVPTLLVLLAMQTNHIGVFYRDDGKNFDVSEVRIVTNHVVSLPDTNFTYKIDVGPVQQRIEMERVPAYGGWIGLTNGSIIWAR